MAHSAPQKMKASHPLNKKQIIVNENNVKKPVAALHTHWKEPRCFTKYNCLSVDLQGTLHLDNYDQWMNDTTWFIKDMQKLLSLEHHTFWSTIAYNGTALESVLSFVQNALPSYLVPKLNSLPKQHAFSLFCDARTYVFRVICRFTAMREKKSAWIEKEFFANLLYKNFIVTVPFMLDVIAIYGRDNRNEVSRIIEHILTVQPKYMDDFRQGLSYLVNVFTVIQTRCESDLLNGATEAVLSDLALYAHDCAYTLNVMVDVSPTLRGMCSELNCEFAISNFYDNAVLVLFKKIQEANETSSYLELLNDTRVELLEAFRSIVTIQLHTILSVPEESLLAADKFLSILTECLANNVFVDDYKSHYETEDDLQIVQTGFQSGDIVKFDFIKKAYTSEQTHPEQSQSSELPVKFVEDTTNYQSQDDFDHNQPSASGVAKQQKQIDVQTIMELLPHLDVEHVRNTVSRYESIEEAIAALLEQDQQTEAQSTAQAEGGEVIIPNDPLDDFYLKTGIDRLNIYDGDEFDVMVNDKVKGIIKKGKGMPGPKTSNELLDDKSHVRQMRHIYQQFDMIADNEPEDDDEYDDSFDAMAESESRHVKAKKAVRNVLADDGLDKDSESEKEKEKEAVAEPDKHRNLPQPFCENPEVVRKRREEQLNSKYLRRHGTAVPASAKDGKGSDVRGKPKGQGQDAKVLQNRKKKSEHKASVGNHNRKQGASYKRNRGVIPS